MAAATFEITASYIDIAHTYGEIDIDFYNRLPGVRFEHVNPNTGLPAVPAPGFGNTVRTIVLAVVSSTALTHAIDDYLKTEPTVIEIIVKDGNQEKKLHFEGPNIKQSEPEIEKLIDDLVKGAKGPVHVTAKRKNHIPPKPPPAACEPK